MPIVAIAESLPSAVKWQRAKSQAGRSENNLTRRHRNPTRRAPCSPFFAEHCFASECPTDVRRMPPGSLWRTARNARIQSLRGCRSPGLCQDLPDIAPCAPRFSDFSPVPRSVPASSLGITTLFPPSMNSRGVKALNDHVRSRMERKARTPSNLSHDIVRHAAPPFAKA